VGALASGAQSPIVFEVTLKKIDGSFGMQIAGGLRKRLGVYIKALKKNGAAARDGRLEKYDAVIRVDDKDFTECTHEEAVAFLAVRVAGWNGY
jgi:C-terminal processing protease CtpA/Prc